MRGRHQAALLAALLMALLVTACDLGTNEDSEATTTASRGQVQRYLDLMNGDLAARLLTKMPCVLDGSEESLEFVRVLTAVEQSPDFPGPVQRKADIAAILAAAEASSWYAADPPLEKRLLLAGLLEIYTVGYEEQDEESPGRNRPRPQYPWKDLIIEVIQNDLHAAFRGAAGRPVQLVAWGHDPGLAREALNYAEEHLSSVEEVVGPYRARYILLIVDSEIDEPFCGATYLGVAVAVFRPLAECSLEITVAHELTHLIRISGASPWFDEGIASFIAYRATGEDLDRRAQRFRDEQGEATFLPDLFHLTEEDELGIEDLGIESAAGYLFVYEYEKLVGLETLAAVIQRVSQNELGQEILDFFYEAAPAEQQAEVEALIASFCRIGRAEGASPCAPS